MIFPHLNMTGCHIHLEIFQLISGGGILRGYVIYQKENKDDSHMQTLLQTWRI